MHVSFQIEDKYADSHTPSLKTGKLIIQVCFTYPLSLFMIYAGRHINDFQVTTSETISHTAVHSLSIILRIYDDPTNMYTTLQTDLFILFISFHNRKLFSGSSHKGTFSIYKTEKILFLMWNHNIISSKNNHLQKQLFKNHNFIYCLRNKMHRL